MLTSLLFIAGLLAAGCLASVDPSAEALPATHFALLTGSSSVPPVATAELGVALVWVSADGKDLRVTLVHTVIPDATAIHVHGPAQPGETAGVLETVSSGQTPPGVVIQKSGPVEGAGTVESLLAGTAYVNVHSSASPDGRIRGQILATGTTLATTGSLLDARLIPGATDFTPRGVQVCTYDPVRRSLSYTVFHTVARTDVTSVVLVGSAGAVLRTLSGTQSPVVGNVGPLTNAEIAELEAGTLRIVVRSVQQPDGAVASPIRASTAELPAAGNGGDSSTDGTTDGGGGGGSSGGGSDSTAVGFAVVAWLALGAIGAVVAAVWWKSRGSDAGKGSSTAYNIGAPTGSPEDGVSDAPPAPPRDNQGSYGQQQSYAPQPQPPAPSPAPPPRQPQPPPPAAAAPAASGPVPPPKPVDF